MDITRGLTKHQKYALENIINACAVKNVNCYVVGGAVRDAVLDIPPRDIDICIDADPKELLVFLKLKEYLYHPEFHTAWVKFNNGTEFDIIQCRKEIYETQGALPNVFPSSIYDDLKRRDFTINAIAFDLINGKLMDPFNGMQDIEKAIIRRVHSRSYEEDPTRIFRAVKYAVRYNFTITDADEIQKCIKNNVMDSISNDRYFNEIASICREDKWEQMLQMCSSVNLFKLKEYKGINVLADYSTFDARLLNFAFRLNSENVLGKILNNSCIKKELKKAVFQFKYGDMNQRLQNSRDNYDIYNLLKKSSALDRIMLCFDYKNMYKVLCYTEHMNYKPVLKGDYIKIAAGIQGKTLGKAMDYIAKVTLNTGIKDEKKYFEENLGEILNAIKY